MTTLSPDFILRNHKANKPILAFDDWTEPKEPGHWKPGRSAQELANSWFRGGQLACPTEVGELLQSSRLTADALLLEGAPEHVTSLPKRGEGRNHDLWLRGTARGKGLTLCIEAKADESFDLPLREALERARKKSANTGLPHRAASLLATLFGGAPDPDQEPWADLRYQLISAAGGTVLQAREDNSSTAVLLVHEFATRLTSPEKLAQNGADLEDFISLLFSDRRSGGLSGPVVLPAGKRGAPIAFLMGKISVPRESCAPMSA